MRASLLSILHVAGALLVAACATRANGDGPVVATQTSIGTTSGSGSASTASPGAAPAVNPVQTVAEALKAYASQTDSVERTLHGFVVASNFADPKPCQLIPLFQAPTTDCPLLTPTFWIADRIDAPESERIPVLGLASSIAVLLAALEAGAARAPVVEDPMLAVKVNNPIPCVGGELTVRGDHKTSDVWFPAPDARAPTGVLRASELRVTAGGCDAATLERWRALSQTPQDVGPPTLGRLVDQARAASREAFSDASCNVDESLKGDFVAGQPGVAALIRCTAFDAGEPSTRHWLALLAGDAGVIEPVDEWGINPEGSDHGRLLGILESQNARGLVLEEGGCTDAGCSSELSVWTASFDASVLQVNVEPVEHTGLEFARFTDWEFGPQGGTVTGHVACTPECVVSGKYEFVHRKEKYLLVPKGGTATSCARCR